MMYFQCFCFIFSLLGMVHLCHALTCTPLTDNTCTKSLYVTGQCVSGMCQCVNGTPIERGCQRACRPNVSGTFHGVTWSHEGTEDEEVTLSCDMMPCDVSYPTIIKWYQNDVEINSTDEGTLRVDLIPGSWNFHCVAVDYGGLKSGNFSINVRRKRGKPFTKKPVVAEMPEWSLLDSVFMIYCSNIPAFNGSFVFTVDGKETTTVKPEFSLTMSSNKFNKEVTCTVKPNDGSTNVTSDPVSTPASPAIDIPDVVIRGRNQYYARELHFLLRCEFNETFNPEKGIKYTWNGPNGTVKHGHQFYSKVIATLGDAGAYSCVVSYYNITKRSPQFNVSVYPFYRNYIETLPAKPVVGGYISLQCKTKGFVPPFPKYYWDWDNPNPDFGHTDSIVQINNIGANNLGRWAMCTFDILKHGYRRFISSPLPMSDAIQPTIKVSSISGQSDAYVMTCKSEYNTPGTHFVWFVENVTHANTSSDILYYSQSEPSSINIKCRLYFNSKVSEYSKSCAIPGRGLVSTPMIEVEGSPHSLIVGASYTLKCSCLQYVGATYSWGKNGEDLQLNTFSMSLDNIDTKTNGNYTCTVTLGKDSKQSKSYQVLAQDEIEAPVIQIVASPHVEKYGIVRQLKKGGTYYLLCSSPAHYESATYSWRKGSVDIDVPDNILRLYNVDFEDNAMISCQIKVGNRSKESGSVLTLTQDFTTRMSSSGPPFIVGGDYSITCHTILSSFPGHFFSYRWKKDTKEFQFHGEEFSLDNIQAEANGVYTCSIVLGTKEIESTSKVSIAVKSDGKFCTSNGNCTGEGFSNVCFRRHCTCKTFYHFQGHKCVKSQGVHVGCNGTLFILAALSFKYLINILA